MSWERWQYFRDIVKVRVADDKDFLLKFCVKILFCNHYFSQLNTFMRKGKDPDPDPYLLLIDPDPGGPKACGSCGSGSSTLHSPNQDTANDYEARQIFKSIPPLANPLSFQVYQSANH